jgi:hypothetical protein
MHDCKIPITSDQRDIEVKKYVEKLESLEKQFADAEKLNIELDPSHSR